MQAEPLVLPPVCCYTGRVAALAPFPQPAAATAQSAGGGGLPPLKTSSPGVWLRSDAGGVLAVQWRPDAPPLLTCTLRSSQQLVRAPLRRGGFAFRLLCPAHGAPAAAAGGSSGHVLFLSLLQPPAAGDSSRHDGTSQPAGQQPRTATIALHFDTPQAGRECGALLQAIHQGSLTVVAPPGQVPPPAAAPAAPAAAAKAAAASGTATAGEAADGARGGAAAGGQGGAAAAADNWDDLFGYADEAELEAAIEAAQADPQFLELAARLEQAVERVEGVLDKQQGQQQR